MKSKTIKLAIATPTYNEAKNIPKLAAAIEKTIRNIPDLTCTLLVIDDNSPDKTGAIAERLAKKYSGKHFKVKVLHRKQKAGLGKAYVHGFKELLKQDFDLILQMDADLSHDPKHIEQFIKAAHEADLVVGSRYTRGGATPDWKLYRKILSRGGNFYTRLFLGRKISDYTGGFNLYSAKLLKKLDLDSLQAGGYGFLIELKHRAMHAAEGIREVPIVFMDREHGVSKIPKNTIFKNLLLVPKIKLASLRKKTLKLS